VGAPAERAMMKVATLEQTIPLRAAFLCINCDRVSRNARNCPDCGSTAMWPLASWLDRVAK
jgi:ribosomal protein S27AE